MSADLVERALRGESAAVESLVGDLLPVIRMRVRRRLRGAVPDAELEDVAQDVWVKLVAGDGRELRRFDPTRGYSLANYVGLIAEREAGNHLASLRAKKRGFGFLRASSLEVVEYERSAPSAENAIADKELLVRLTEHLDRELPPKGRAVFRFMYCDGHTVDEVAAIVGVSTQVVYNWQHKIRTLAREFCVRATEEVL
jgi:RNA polymerase sigma factor (sigma-70 family)